jgi:tetratricopeptide (TPR) repeat protein
MPRVFVSYARQDLSAVQQLERALQAHDVTVWRDQASIYGGQQWPKAIGEAIAAHDYVVLVWSERAARSHFVEVEWNSAIALRKTILPCVLDDTPLPPALRAINAISAKQLDDALPRILQALQRPVPSPEPVRSAEVIAQLSAPPGGLPPVGHGQQASPPAIWNVPHRPNPHFTGRADLLKALHDSGTDAQPVVLTQVLRGLGGIGKTQLALEYAYRYGGRYCLVWWVRAEEPATLASDYAALAEPLNLEEKAAQEQRETITAVRQWLEHHEGWLLILDNAPEPAAIQAYLPRATHGRIIITSRHFGWGGTARALTIPVLPREGAVKLLLDVTQQSDGETAGAIAQTLGDLPLALAQAAAYIDAIGLSLTGYLQRLKTQLEEYLNRGQGSPDYPKTVATTWTMAFEALQEAQPAALSLLKLCAFFAPDDIPEALVREAVSALPEPLGAVVTDDLQWDDALVALRHYALIEGRQQNLAMHRLVQAITRDRLPVDERTQWAEAALKCVAAAFPVPGSWSAWEPRTWPTCARYLPHAVAVVSHVGGTDTAALETALLLNHMGMYVGVPGQFAEAKPYFERALAIREQVQGPQHPDTAYSLNSLGVLLRAQGDLTGAKPYLERALAIREQVQGPQHPDTAYFLNSLGVLLYAQGGLAGAKPYLERALRICRLRLGKDHALSLSVIDEVNCPHGVSMRTAPGAVMPFSSMTCNEFAAHGSDVGIGPNGIKLAPMLLLSISYVPLMAIESLCVRSAQH